ncbi:hypothetical protein [Paenibacillus sp. 1P07SE]|uniref:hypothetical protein n=1 Tax=Paenibacillus sp. 1P07SE TaxID=3132209 RepID=UPI0039A48C08
MVTITKTPKEVLHDEDVQTAYALETVLHVYSLQAADGRALAAGIVTDWNEEAFFIDHIAYIRDRHVFLNFES